MIQRDYLLAIIEDFFRALVRVIDTLRKKSQKPEVIEKEIDGLYTRFLQNNRNYFLTHSIKQSIAAFSDPTKIQMQKEILAELLYQELKVFDYQIDKKTIASNLLALYDDIEQSSQTFSFQRETRKREVEQWLL
ncbi:MAG: hypothetical protein Q4D14_07405 [Bacteroidales bacterium]|nr:hypothetical protein [Bacteroidales bacterium]